jgi:hypothetical protein
MALELLLGKVFSSGLRIRMLMWFVSRRQRLKNGNWRMIASDLKVIFAITMML